MPSLIAGRAFFFAAALLTLIAGCSTTSRVAELPGAGRATHGLNVTGLLPGGGAPAEAVKDELAARGMRILDAAAIADYLASKGLTESLLARPENRAYLREKGVDAILVVRDSASGQGQPHRLSAYIESTATGARLAGVTWQNLPALSSCVPGGATPRRSEYEAACDVAEALLQQLGP